jgi:hypothetical protein
MGGMMELCAIGALIGYGRNRYELFSRFSSLRNLAGTSQEYKRTSPDFRGGRSMHRAFSKVVRFARSHSRSVAIGVRKALATAVSFAFALAPAAPGILPATAEAKTPSLPAGAQVQANAASQCVLHSAQGAIKHVIYIQFDNVHFTRDNPNVPSDLEQMPHLLNFFVNSGTFSSNHHTPLISHTADDIITSLTGVYGERHGQPVSNSFNYFNPADPDGLGSTFTSSFKYWTDIVDPVHDPTFSLLTHFGKNAPAPWVPFTRAGCNVGAVSIANMEIENTGSDITTIFGAGSPEAIEAATPNSSAVADFEGIAIHCAKNDPVCAAGNSKRICCRTNPVAMPASTPCMVTNTLCR